MSLRSELRDGVITTAGLLVISAIGWLVADYRGDPETRALLAFAMVVNFLSCVWMLHRFHSLPDHPEDNP